MKQRGTLLGLLLCTAGAFISSDGNAGWPPDPDQTSDTAVIRYGGYEAGALHENAHVLASGLNFRAGNVDGRSAYLFTADGSPIVWRREES